MILFVSIIITRAFFLFRLVKSVQRIKEKQEKSSLNSFVSKKKKKKKETEKYMIQLSEIAICLLLPSVYW